MTMLFPDVGQYKLQQLKALERAHIKLKRPFDPNEYAPLSRKDLQHTLHNLSLEISKNSKSNKRAGLVNVC